MPATEPENEENRLRNPEEFDQEDPDVTDGVSADDGGRGFLAPEPDRGPDGIEEVDSMCRGWAATAPAVGNLHPENAIERRLETGIRFVDVRESHELTEGIIPGAVHVPLERVEFAVDPDSPQFDSALEDAVEIVFYCASGRRSEIAAKLAAEMGVDRVAHVEGGIRAWAEADGPVRSDAAPDRR